MYDQDKLLEIHQHAQKAKEHAWYHHGERDTLPRVVSHFRFDEMERSNEVPSEMLAHALNNGWTLGGIIETVFKTMPEHLLQQLDEMWISCDAYIDTRESLGDTPERGDLGEDFKVNPATSVSEALITIVASDDRCGGCDIQDVTQTYTVSDGGQMVWGESRSSENTLNGAVANAISAGFRKELS